MKQTNYPLSSLAPLISLPLLLGLMAMVMLTAEITKTVIIEWTILKTTSFHLSISFMADNQSTLFCSIVAMITTAVMAFSSTYMSPEPFKSRFTLLIILFVASMVFLVFIPNLFSLMLGWDGLGLVSFLLVIYYLTPKSLGAGMVTALTNRLGDALLLLSLAAIISQHWLTTNLWPIDRTTCLILTTAAFTKSAQIPFSAWLPAAMAAPTPISALVHSSTLVTAGVYLLLRLYPTLNKITLFTSLTLIMGSATMLMASMSAMMETDMKKVIALSTLSQLGLMIFTLGIHLPTLTLFHMSTHALFKALLFICAGFMIHFNSHSQDMRLTSMNSAPLINSSFTVANLALCGIPFMAAFYSKDMILETMTFKPMTSFLFLMALMSTCLTAIYTMRLMISSMWAPNPLMSSSEDTLKLPNSMWILALGAIMVGSMINWALISPLETPLISGNSKMWPLFVTIIGLITVFYNTNFGNISSPINSQMTTSMFLLAPVTYKMPAQMLNNLHQTLPTLDQGWQETFGAKGLTALMTPPMTTMSALHQLSGPSQIMLTILIAIPLMT